jgi:ribosomal protein S18 acetylase RimI-like enzyme
MTRGPLYLYTMTISETSIATVDDVAALNHLINSAYRGESAKQGWTHEADLLTGIRTTERELKNMITRKNTFILKYIENGIITACVLVEKKADKLYMGMLTVSPRLQGRGVGKKLLKATEETAIKLQCKKIEMTVIDARQELISWYTRNGYKDTGKRMTLPSEIQNAVVPGRNLQFIVMEKDV